MSTYVPSIENLLSQWWGTDPQCYAFLAVPGAASNIVIGSNPPFQVSDFLAIFPKFGQALQAVTTLFLGSGGTGYSVNDTLTLVQSDASNCTITVNTVDGSGVILTWSIVTGGTGYSTANGLGVTGGHGTGATFNVTGISPTNLVVIPVPVLQLFINMASASLQAGRWFDNWTYGMALYAAHFATLYLRSEGNPNSTAGQIATSGLERGVQVSKSVGGVSVGIEQVTGLDEFAGWKETTYGVQLATMAKVVGIGPMYIW